MPASERRPHSDEGEQRLRDAYRPNLDRLVEIKRRYDPNTSSE